MTQPSHAVFLSYASQDAEAAQKICGALRAAGIEVWFDQSELRGGDAWDQSIRKQIKTCALFIPIISRATHDRREGYFRLEWKLAVDRSHLMDSEMAFLLPVVIDDTRDDDERVPERFREVQWTRLPGGATPATFVERVRRLLSGELSQQPTRTASAAALPTVPSTQEPILASWRLKAVLLGTIGVLVVAVGYFVANPLALSKRGAEVGPAAAFAPPPHSLAVLPFVNMSGEKEQDYFSDGLTEELLNSLARINELQVAARTSAFSFRGKDVDIETIGRKLNVGAILEGSVRRAGRTVRVTAQLDSAVTGFHLWSETYDRSLDNVLAIQTDIASAVAKVLTAKLLADTGEKLELGGTHNAAALDAYLRATRLSIGTVGRDIRASIAEYGQAIKLDSNFALAYAGRSAALQILAYDTATGDDTRSSAVEAEQDAHKAIALAPGLGIAHAALAGSYEIDLRFESALQEYRRAMSLEPGNARILSWFGFFSVAMGKSDAGIAALQRAVTLDPLNDSAHNLLAVAMILTRRYDDARAVLVKAQANSANQLLFVVNIGIAEYFLGKYEAAVRSCEKDASFYFNEFCLAVAYEKLGRHQEAEAALAKMRLSRSSGLEVFYAWALAQWGQKDRALDALEAAMRLRDPYLEQIKTSEFVDPLRNEPRFQAIQRELKFPE